jgi:hypothetical protein
MKVQDVLMLVALVAHVVSRTRYRKTARSSVFCLRPQMMPWINAVITVMTALQLLAEKSFMLQGRLRLTGFTIDSL